MYNKAINKLTEEIQTKEKLIHNIQNFKTLTLDEKIQTIKNCSLKYEEDILQIIKSEMKSEVLKNSKVSRGANYIYLTVDTYSFKIALNYNKEIVIENANEMQMYYTMKNIPEFKNKEFQRLASLEQYNTKSSYKNFKNAISYYNNSTYKDYGRLKFLIFKSFINRDLTQRIIHLSNAIKVKDGDIKRHKAKILKNVELEQQNSKFLESIKDDLKYFYDNNYTINYKFTNKYDENNRISELKKERYCKNV